MGFRVESYAAPESFSRSMSTFQHPLLCSRPVSPDNEGDKHTVFLIALQLQVTKQIQDEQGIQVLLGNRSSCTTPRPGKVWRAYNAESSGLKVTGSTTHVVQASIFHPRSKWVIDPMALTPMATILGAESNCSEGLYAGS